MSSPNEGTPLLNIVYGAIEVDEAELKREIAKNWGLILAAGCIHMLAGILALIAPVSATVLSLAFVTGALFVVGFFNILGLCYAEKGWRVASGLVGAFEVFIGILMATHAVESLVVITYMIGIMFMIEGIYRCMFAFRNRYMPGWGWTFTNGMCGILVSVLIFSAFPKSATYTLGILLGANWVSFGAARIAIGIAGRDMANSQIESGESTTYVSAP